MARIRTIKPEFWTDSLMVQLPHFTRLLYVALWNAADDHGYIRDEPERLAMELMPREPIGDVDAALQLLVACGRLEWLGSPEGESFYRVARWEDHQRVDHPGKSKLFREGSRKLAIPLDVRRGVAKKYGCPPGGSVASQCYYCGAPGSVHWFKLADGRPSSWVVFPELELDHLDPEAGGGENSCENIVLACRRCNRSKGTAHWLEFFTAKNLAKPREASRELAPDQGSGKGKEQGREQGTGNARELAVSRETPRLPERNARVLIAKIRELYPVGLYREAEWAFAERELRRRIDEGEATAPDMVAAVAAYAMQQQALGKVGTQYVLSPAKFFNGSGAWKGPFPTPSKAETALEEIRRLNGLSSPQTSSTTQLHPAIDVTPEPVEDEPNAA